MGSGSGTVTDGYWDTDTTDIADDVNNTGQEGKTTSQLQTPTAYGATGIYKDWDGGGDMSSAAWIVIIAIVGAAAAGGALWLLARRRRKPPDDDASGTPWACQRVWFDKAHNERVGPGMS